MSPPPVKSPLALGLKQSHEVEHKSPGISVQKTALQAARAISYLEQEGTLHIVLRVKCPVGVMSGATEASLALEYLNITSLHS